MPRIRNHSRFLPVLLGALVLSALLFSSIAWADSGGVAPGGGPPASAKHAGTGGPFGRTLREGQWGSDVRRLQTWLSDLGYRVPSSGYFDAATRTAVQRFQRSHHLHPAAGAVDRRTANTLLGALRRAGYDASGAPLLVDPIPGFRIGRDDMGVDAEANPGAPIYAPVASRLVQVMQDWYAGEPLLLFQFLHKPAGAMSDYWYVAEQISPVTERIGATFSTGARVAAFAASGTGIEIGWGSPTANSRTLAGASDSGSSNPPSGSQTRWGESFKRFFHIH